jgi:anti-sigma28 factor (negative regulator of flagellin synthesis)
MRIDDNGTTGIGSPGLGRAQQSADVTARNDAATARTLRGSGGDEVSLSSLAGRLNAAEEGSPEWEARIASLSAAYLAGNYEADPESVADGIIGEAESQGPIG